MCEERHEAPITAPAPPVILPKSMASPSLLAHVIKSKFDLGLPLYRVSQDLNSLPDGLGSGHARHLGEHGRRREGRAADQPDGRGRCSPSPFMHIDETPLQVLRSDKAVGSDHYIVVRAGGPPGQRIILYDYIASRTTAALKQLFVGPDGPYQGKLISDGLERYDDIAAELKLLHFGCLTHCRTMFFKARKVSQLPSSRTLANAAHGGLHRSGLSGRGTDQGAAGRVCSSAGKTLPLETVRTLRQEKSKPILEKFKAWVDELLPGTPPNSALGKALGYTSRQWPKLVRHLDHPEMPVDNNYMRAADQTATRPAEKHGSSATMRSAPRRAPICIRW